MKALKPRTVRIGKRALIVVAVLVAIRAALPWGIEKYINHTLAEHPTYGGQVEDVDLQLWRGAYSFESVRLSKKRGGSAVPFLEIPVLRISIGWRELLRGQVVTHIFVDRPRVEFLDTGKPAAEAKEKAAPLDQLLDRMVPFRVAQLKLENGEIHFRDPQADPPIDVSVRELRVDLENLTNSRELTDVQFAQLRSSGVTVGNGRFELGMHINPNAKTATFDLNARLLGLDLTALNPLFKKYGKLDFEKGVGDIVVELAAADGRIRGYVKPLFKNLEVFELKQEIKRDHDSIFRVAWEAIAGAVSGLFKNQPKDQLATRIPVDGKIDDPETSVWTIAGGVLRNAFISAFRPFYDQSVSLKRR